MGKLKEAIYEETEKVVTAFVSWGLGILFMVGYCIFIYWLNKIFNIYVTIGGALLFLAVFFFFIDLWWSYNKGKTG
ncbi:MAG: hypothetical protein ACYC21_06360 [Eubacteriales bacterium]